MINKVGKGGITHDNVQNYIKQEGPWVAHLRMTDQWSGTIC